MDASMWPGIYMYANVSVKFVFANVSVTLADFGHGGVANCVVSRVTTIVIFQILNRVQLVINSFKHMWLFDQLFVRISLSNAHSR